MTSTRLIVWLAAVLGIAALGYYVYATSRPVPAPAPETVVSSSERPQIEIEVAGQASGTITIELFNDVAPAHVQRILTLTNEGAYDGIVFHRVIDGFMAQTGDVQFGKQGDSTQAGRGGSSYPDLRAEFSDLKFERGVVGMARSNSPDSANSQFFIMFDAAPFLDGQYTIVGKVTSGLDVLDAIKLGEGANGVVIGQPDAMRKVTQAR